MCGSGIQLARKQRNTANDGKAASSTGAAVATGTVTIYAEANDGSGVKGVCTVTVTPATITVIWNADVFDGYGFETYVTKDGIALTTDDYIDCSSRAIEHGGTFTTSLGKFTKIEVTAANACNISGTGWSDKKTWTGDASSSVSFSGYIYGTDYFQIIFTIEQ